VQKFRLNPVAAESVTCGNSMKKVRLMPETIAEDSQIQPQPTGINLVKSAALRWLLIVLATIFLVLGFIGVFLPVLPTTPFILLAAGLYSRSSPKFYNWIINHHLFGSTLKKWRQDGAISTKSKIVAITAIVFTLGSSILFFIPNIAIKIGLGIFGLGLIGFIVSRPK